MSDFQNTAILGAGVIGMSWAALFLASDDSAHVQGQELFVDGGATASPSGAPIYRG